MLLPGEEMLIPQLSRRAGGWGAFLAKAFQGKGLLVNLVESSSMICLVTSSGTVAVPLLNPFSRCDGCQGPRLHSSQEGNVVVKEVGILFVIPGSPKNAREKQTPSARSS